MLWLFYFNFELNANEAEADDDNADADEAIEADADETDEVNSAESNEVGVSVQLPLLLTFNKLWESLLSLVDKHCKGSLELLVMVA